MNDHRLRGLVAAVIAGSFVLGLGGRETAAAPPGSDLTNTIGMKLTLIPAGSFKMGSPETDKDAFDDEKPQHSVRITKAFYLGVHEVTQGQFKQIMGDDPKPNFKGSESRPMESVSWFEAAVFCNALSVKEGFPPFYTIDGTNVSVVDWNGTGYRLPTEAEWEYACRAGKPTRYSFGDEPMSLGAFAWFKNNSDVRTHPVGEKPANAYGLHDMHGNVYEWCWDGVGKYGASAAVDPRGPDAAPDRVFRGGSWYYTAWSARSAYRHGASPGSRDLNLGFRIARVQLSR